MNVMNIWLAGCKFHSEGELLMYTKFTSFPHHVIAVIMNYDVYIIKSMCCTIMVRSCHSLLLTVLQKIGLVSGIGGFGCMVILWVENVLRKVLLSSKFFHFENFQATIQDSVAGIECIFY
jgi:hypothetical protein